MLDDLRDTKPTVTKHHILTLRQQQCPLMASFPGQRGLSKIGQIIKSLNLLIVIILMIN